MGFAYIGQGQQEAVPKGWLYKNVWKIAVQIERGCALAETDETASTKMKKIKPYHGAGLLLWTKEDHNIFVVLGKRSINPGRGKWSIPGGKWDREDDSYDKNGKPNYLRTALRETKEEISLVIKENDNIVLLWSSLIPIFHFNVYSQQLDNRIAFNHIEEFLEVNWFSVDALPEQCEWFVKSQVAALVQRVQE